MKGGGKMNEEEVKELELLLRLLHELQIQEGSKWLHSFFTTAYIKAVNLTLGRIAKLLSNHVPSGVVEARKASDQ